MSKRDVIEALTSLGLAIVIVSFTLVVLGRSGPPRRTAHDATASASTDRSPTPSAGRSAPGASGSEDSTGSVKGLVDSARAARRAANERTVAVQEETRRR